MVGSTPNHHVFCNNRKEQLKDVSTKTKEERITRSTFKENICINIIKTKKWRPRWPSCLGMNIAIHKSELKRVKTYLKEIKTFSYSKITWKCWYVTMFDNFLCLSLNISKNILSFFSVKTHSHPKREIQFLDHLNLN